MWMFDRCLFYTAGSAVHIKQSINKSINDRTVLKVNRKRGSALLLLSWCWLKKEIKRDFKYGLSVLELESTIFKLAITKPQPRQNNCT
mmetsp:Transcript_29790/g.55893  ORF Transcript_29790/g.55893 Transcript_29790/m.55893 type:complete len:88 (-) Transcript_29790:344-607(-)